MISPGPSGKTAAEGCPTETAGIIQSDSAPHSLHGDTPSLPLDTFLHHMCWIPFNIILFILACSSKLPDSARVLSNSLMPVGGDEEKGEMSHISYCNLKEEVLKVLRGNQTQKKFSLFCSHFSAL